MTIRLSIILALCSTTVALAQQERPAVPEHTDPVVQGTQEHVNRLCDRHDARIRVLQSRAELTKAIETSRREFRKLIGLPERASARKPPAARLIGKLDFPEYTIERVIIETAPGVPVPCNIYVPKGGPEKKPALLSPHGHSGRDRPIYQNAYQRFAKAGFLVLAKDGWGKQERRGTGHGARGGQLFLTGGSLMALELYDNMRCIDYLLARPDVDGERLGMTGISGGGSQTLYTTAIEPRIRASSPTCAVCSFQSDVADTTMCVCELAADILTIGDHGWFLAMAFPRPVLVVNGIQDGIFPIQGARASVAQARRLYELGGKKLNIEFAEYNVPHTWNDDMLTRQIHWFRKQFGLRRIENPPLGDGFRPYELLQCFPDGDLPDGSLTLADLNRLRMQKFLGPIDGLPRDQKDTLEQDTRFVVNAIRSRWSSKPTLPQVSRSDLAPDRHRIVTRKRLNWKSGLGGSVSATISTPIASRQKPYPVVVHLDRDRLMPRLERLYWEDRIRSQAIVVDFSYTGKTLATRQEGQVATALLSAGRSLAAERVRDMLVLLRVLRAENTWNAETQPITFVGHGFDGVLLLLAAPQLPPTARLALDQTPITYRLGREIDFTTSELLAPPAHWTILPGFAKRLDLSALIEIAQPRRALLMHPLDAAQDSIDVPGLDRLFGSVSELRKRNVDVYPEDRSRTEILRRLVKFISTD